MCPAAVFMASWLRRTLVQHEQKQQKKGNGENPSENRALFIAA